LFSGSGTFFGTAPGIFGSDIRVSLTVNQGGILAIDVSHTETQGWGDIAIDRMRNTMMANQVIGVDLVSGATGTSAGFRSAVFMAAEAAGGNMGRLLVPTPLETHRFSDQTVDVVVVGSGVAGFTAAIALREARPDWHVVIIEKAGILGGNSTRASVNWGTSLWSNFVEAAGGPRPAQPAAPTTNTGHAARINATNLQHVHNFVWYGGGRGRFIVGPTTPLTNALGALRLPNQSVPGAQFTVTMQNKANQIGVDIRPNNDGIELIQPGGPGTRVTGIRVGVNPRTPNAPPPRVHDYTYTLTAREAVIIATGGFHQNMEMKREHILPYLHLNPQSQRDTPWSQDAVDRFARIFIDDLWTTAAETNTGDGHLMAAAAGAALGGMYRHTVNYAAVRVPNIRNTLSVASIRERGAINIRHSDGRRLPQAEPNQTFHLNDTWEETDGLSDVWMIVNFRNHMNEIGNIRDYFLADMVLQSGTLRGLGEAMGLSPEGINNFEATMNQIMVNARVYAAHQQNVGWTTVVPGATLRTLPGTSANAALGASCFSNTVFDATRRQIAWHWGNNTEIGPFFAFRNFPGVHGTGGGIRIDLGGRALTANNEIIPGLYAAGTASWFSPEMSAQNIQAAGSTGFSTAMAILGRPLYVDFEGRPGPIVQPGVPMLP
jgi:fluoride ion exporter CrcB/FEX